MSTLTSSQWPWTHIACASSHTALRNSGLFVLSIAALFALQPKLSGNISNFLLPCATLFITLATHAILRPPANVPRWSEVGTIIVILLLFAVVQLAPEIRNRSWIFLIAMSAGGILTCAGIGVCARISLRRILERRKVFIGASIALLITLLFLVKDTALLQRISAILGIGAGTVNNFSWLGFSYIAFRLIGTLRDASAGRLPAMSLSEFVTYVVFAPALIAGPIERAERFVSDLRATWVVNIPDFVAGMQRIAIGSLKKFIFADTLAMMALHPINAPHVHAGIPTWVVAYAYALQIFFDFAGYSDMAIGAARCLGIRLPENFANPYFAPNLTQFWHRWHMSLTQWIRAYYFNPLARALRRRELSPAVIIATAQVSTMLLIGLWHGVSMNFAVWGLWHGIGLFLHNRWNEFARRRLAIPEERLGLQRTANIVGAFVTFHYVTLGWVWFALPNPSMSLLVFRKLFGIG